MVYYCSLKNSALGSSSPDAQGVDFTLSKFDLEPGGGDRILLHGYESAADMTTTGTAPKYEAVIENPTSITCTSDLDCSLNGKCSLSTRLCECSQNFFGTDCSIGVKVDPVPYRFVKVSFVRDLHNQGKNYTGFILEFNGKYECPQNCSGNGDCVAGVCQCFDGFDGQTCTPSSSTDILIPVVCSVAGVTLILTILVVLYLRHRAKKRRIYGMQWLLDKSELVLTTPMKAASSVATINSTSNSKEFSCKSENVSFRSLKSANIGSYKGRIVRLKTLGS